MHSADGCPTPLHRVDLERNRQRVIRLRELDSVSCIHPPPQGIQELAWGTAVVRQKITAVMRGKSTFWVFLKAPQAKFLRIQGLKPSAPGAKSHLNRSKTHWKCNFITLKSQKFPACGGLYPIWLKYSNKGL